MPVYEVKPEVGNGRSRVLHRNLLLPCSHLPVETQLKSSKSRSAVPRRTNRPQASQEETAGTTDEDIPSLTPDQLHELYGCASYCAQDNCGIVPELVEQDTGTETQHDPCEVDGPSLEEDVDDSGGQDNTVDDETVDGLPLRKSHRLNRPLIRMTCDVMGQPYFQPSSTAGVQGIAVSYPQQLWRPVTVP